MLQAKNSKGELVTLASLPRAQINQVRKQESFYCPECASLLIVRAGPRVIPHFAHPSTTSCTLSSAGESAYHQKAKFLLCHWLQRQNVHANLEVYLQKIKQRPDILLTYNKKVFAMEFQHTTTDIVTIRQRNEGYKQLNIIPIWILGASFLKRTTTNTLKVNDFTLQFVHQFSKELPTSVYYFSPEQQVISIVNDLHLTNRRETVATITYEKLSQVSFKGLFLPRKLSQQQLFTKWRNEKRKLRLTSKRMFGRELTWRRWLYNQQLHTDHLPSIVHLPTSTQHFFKVPPWHWQSHFVIAFLHPLSVGQTFKKTHIEQFLRPYLYPSTEYPLLIHSDPQQSYLHLLIQLHYVKKVNATTYMKTKDIEFYNHIEQAIKGDNELLASMMYNHN